MFLPWTGIPMDRQWLRLSLLLFALWPEVVSAEEIPEYRMKAVYLYNFASFVEWPTTGQERISFCVFGEDPFGEHLEQLKGQKIGGRLVSIRVIDQLTQLNDCGVVFISRSSQSELRRVLGELKGKRVLTVADMKNAVDEGVVFNMLMHQNRVVFEANLKAAQENGLDISSNLMRLAIRVVR